jgi:hypothetical protein
MITFDTISVEKKKEIAEYYRKSFARGDIVPDQIIKVNKVAALVFEVQFVDASEFDALIQPWSENLYIVIARNEDETEDLFTFTDSPENL